MGLISRIFHGKIEVPSRLKDFKNSKLIRLSYRSSGYAYNSKIPTYDISVANKSGGQTHLGIVRVDPKNGGEEYTVFYHLVGQKRVDVETDEDLAEASVVAYRTARDVAQEIAKKNRLKLEDVTLDDETEEEDAELKRQIDSLRRREFLLIFFASSLIIGITFSTYSLTATGNAISNLIGTTEGLLGLVFFIVGIMGLVFGKK